MNASELYQSKINDMHIIHHSTITYQRMKQTRIKIQLEFHHEIANITLSRPFIFPLNLEICCVTSLVNRPAGLHAARAVAARRHVSESLVWHLCQLPVVGPARGGFWRCWVTLKRPGDSDLVFYCSLHLNWPRPLSSSCLSLNLASVWRHIAASQHCCASDLGYWEIYVEAWLLWLFPSS